MLQGADELSRADEHIDKTQLLPQQSFGPAPPPVSSSLVSSSPGGSSQAPSSPAPSSTPPSSVPLPTGEAAPPADVVARLAERETQQEFVVARETRTTGLVGGLNTAQIAAEIHDQCGPLAGTSRIRAYQLALGVSLADVVAQIRT